MILPNDVLLMKDEASRLVRVLWVNPEQGNSFIISLEQERALPEPVDAKSLQAIIREGKAELRDNNAKNRIVDECSLPTKHRELRDEAWRIIEPLVTHEPQIYVAEQRGKLINRRCEEMGIVKQTLYRYLRRYWQRGMTPNALLPDYTASGGKGKERLSSSGIKRGRPRSFGDRQGVNIDEDILRIFRLAITRYYAIDARFTLQGAYEQMIKDFFCDRVPDANAGQVTHQEGHFAEAGFPTVGQFGYWFRKEQDELNIKRKRLSSRVYDKDMRGLTGTSTAEVWGPGARYQIDATIADVYLVSRFNRERIIGRPVLYVVIDVFSRMIVGMYIGLEGPSWVGAMMALANTVADKVAYCAHFGKTIEPDEWPCHHLPATILGDRGEIESRYIETLQNNFNVTVENAAAYRADWKGIVEQRFRLLPAKFKAYVPGYIQPDFRARGGQDYRLDALLDLDQFTRIVIECVLYYNNHHDIANYDQDKDVAADLVLSVPRQLWWWGLENRSGRLRTFSEDRVQFSLMPTDEATVTVHGIRYSGCFYTCARAVESRWFDRARQRGNWKVRISYDPRAMDQIYLHEPESPLGFEVCQLTPRSRAEVGLSLWEIGQQIDMEKHQLSDHRHHRQLRVADLQAGIEQVVQAAVAQAPVSNDSKRQRTSKIREHRAEEKSLNRHQEAFRLGTKTPSVVPADVIPLHPQTTAPNYSLPDISEILNAFDQES
ncbi:MAG: DDE-type integrase/transposase/recombinase [Moraxellaceae bacterium]|nr:DDE-type integrase/transposase/recombinase [Moraxellaceae bacterium]